MKIVIKGSEHKTIRILLPTRLVFNRPAIALWYAFGGEAAASLPCTKEQLFTLIKTFYRCRRTFPDWTLVEVTSSDGEYVKVKL